MNSRHILANYAPIAPVRYPVHSPARTTVKGPMQGRAFSPIRRDRVPTFFNSGRHFFDLRSFLPATAFKDNAT